MVQGDKQIHAYLANFGIIIGLCSLRRNKRTEEEGIWTTYETSICLLKEMPHTWSQTLSAVVISSFSHISLIIKLVTHFLVACAARIDKLAGLMKRKLNGSWRALDEETKG